VYANHNATINKFPQNTGHVADRGLELNMILECAIEHLEEEPEPFSVF